MAAINLFQFDLDKPWNYLWIFYKKAPPPPYPPLMKGQGEMRPLSDVPDRTFPGIRCSVNETAHLRPICVPALSLRASHESSRKVPCYQKWPIRCPQANNPPWTTTALKTTSQVVMSWAGDLKKYSKLIPWQQGLQPRRLGEFSGWQQCILPRSRRLLRRPRTPANLPHIKRRR